MRILILSLALIPLLVLSNVKAVKYTYKYRCSAVGTKRVNITWKALTALNNSLHYTYSVYFCKNYDSGCNTFKLGCVVNSTTSNISTCNIGKELQLDFKNKEYRFLYFVKVDDGISQEEGEHLECHMNMFMKCTEPVDLSLAANDKGVLTLKWFPPPDMGSTDLLCYRILYRLYGSKFKKSEELVQFVENFSYKIHSLLPYRRYQVWLQCALDCASINFWSNVVGPVSALTHEDVPKGTITFLKYESQNEDQQTRNITIFFRLPSQEMWNGNVTHVQVFCYKEQTLCSTKQVSPMPQTILFHSLERNAVYYLQGEYCNNEGCSKRSTNLTIKSDVTVQKGQEMETKKSNDKNWTPTIIGVAVGIGVLIAIVVAAIVFWRCRRNNGNQAALGDMINENEIHPSSSSNNEEDTNEQTYSEYASVCAGNSKATLHPDTTDFHSASARSLNSFNISFADQSSDRNGSLMTIPKDNESLLETCEIELSDMTTS